MTVQAQAAVDFAEIRRLIAALPRLEPIALPALPALGVQTDWLIWLARAQGKTPELRRPRLALFAGAHGCAADSTAQTRAQLERLTSENDPVVKVLGAVDADLRVYELDLDTPTADFTRGPALSEGAAAHAMAYGMMAVEPGVQLLALGGFGAGGEQTYPALLKALEHSADPLTTLAAHGGLECCAIVGAILAARLAKVPVLVDGGAAQSAAAVLAKMAPDSVAHVLDVAAIEREVTAQPGLAAALAIGRLKALAALV